MANQLNENEMHTYVEERLSEYLDNRLPANERARVEQHLRECQRCTASLRSLTWTVSLLKQAPAPALPRSFVLPVPEPAPARRPSFAFRFGLAFAGVAAVFVVALLTVSYLANSTARQLTVAQAPQSFAAQPTVVGGVATPAIESGDTLTSAAKSNTDATNGALQSQATATPNPTSVLSFLPLQPTSVAQPASPPSASGATVETTPSLRNAATLSTYPGEVISDTLSVREGPDDAYREIVRLARGEIVNVIGQATNDTNANTAQWYAIRLDNPPRIGWADARGIRLLTNQTVPTVIVPTATPTP